MKPYAFVLFALILSCSVPQEAPEQTPDNPLLTELNVPLDYANVTGDNLEAYAQYTLEQVSSDLKTIKQQESPTFENLFVAMDQMVSRLYITSNNSFLLYWVSPDSLSRVKGLAGYQRMDSLGRAIFADKELFDQMISFQQTDEYGTLQGHRKLLVDDAIDAFKRSGVNLDDESLERYNALNKEINELTSAYSTNMNTSEDVLVLNEEQAAGLPENFKDTYKAGELNYEIPIINATRGPVMSNATLEATREAYYRKFYNRASDTNLDILDQLRSKRYELGTVMGFPTYADYNLQPKMAKDPERVWQFVNDLVARAKDKAKIDIDILNKAMKAAGDDELNPWDIGYYRNQLLKTEYSVDNEKIREYLPMDRCLEGVFTIYQELLGLEFRKVENASVWHEEVELYEVFEDGALKGRFYLDLFPRPNKESWFYAVPLTYGRMTDEGYEVPVSMLLGNFTRPTETLPSLLSHGELSTLFHEFGHIMDGMAYKGEFASQSDSKSDFVEAMSQIFENWIWDYEMLSTFAKHYETDEVLPKETFDNMVRAKNVNSGLSLLGSLRRCVYDLNLYHLYDPEAPVHTDDIWKKIDEDFDVMPLHVDGTHVQASWIHINTHPVYYYGYLWSEVYAQDMFTVFEQNGLTDQATGKKYRELILANGSQRDIVEAVEEFLGRPSNNEAYIKSLGLE